MTEPFFIYNVCKYQHNFVSVNQLIHKCYENRRKSKTEKNDSGGN
jgi:hypothetical protein